MPSLWGRRGCTQLLESFICAEIMDYLDEVKAAEKVALEHQKIAAQEAIQRAALLEE